MAILALLGSVATHWAFGLNWWQVTTVAVISLVCASER